ncbi:glutamate racemase [Pectinatus brassicae]|uniref:Glutamate racemase n=1 Tax=Pectinatus brassicae TaxID=862415 RepID=A0A840UL40_9FIRM|nr:glutamate racemase [Pectinatus brassicae]MBB5336880.1 glutamate racemase [Pectinatus brassicae]
MQIDAPIGVFDSGSGGLTVVKQLHDLLPNENIIYVGDLKRMPYGPRRPEQIIGFMKQFLNFFTAQKVKMAVFACNTMTSWGYELIKDKLPYPVIPMDTAVAEALKYAPHKNIGVIATEATIKKNFHREVAATIEKNISLTTLACSDFVPLIEAGHIDDNIIDEKIKSYMQVFSGKNIESLILGCTHYPIIKQEISKYLGDAVTLIDPAVNTAKNTKQVLKQMDLLQPKAATGELEFFFSSSLDHAKDMVETVVKVQHPVVNKINLEDFS